MGNYKFRLSDMIPNAWFYKLKDMNRVKNQLKTKQGIKEKKHTPSSSSSISSSSSSIAEPNNPYMSDQRKSYHFTRDFNHFHPKPPKISEKKFTTEPPRKSTRRRRIRNRALNRMPDPSSPSDSDRALTPDTLDVMLCKCRVQNDIVIDFVVNDTELNRLPPIITKKTPIEAQRNGYGSSRRVPSSSTSPGVRLRTNTPRIGNRRIHGGGGGGGGRKSLSLNSNSSSGSSRRSVGTESFAVVKTSKDPRRDFRESMVEMIVENNISASKDLEELLANYLSLNSDEYHDLIINVFKQIWFDFVHVLPK